jgi:hypothetical protein
MEWLVNICNNQYSTRRWGKSAILWPKCVVSCEICEPWLLVRHLVLGLYTVRKSATRWEMKRHLWITVLTVTNAVYLHLFSVDGSWRHESKRKLFSLVWISTGASQISYKWKRINYTGETDFNQDVTITVSSSNNQTTWLSHRLLSRNLISLRPRNGIFCSPSRDSDSAFRGGHCITEK